VPTISFYQLALPASDNEGLKGFAKDSPPIRRSLNREKLTERMKGLRSGSDSAMPPPPSETSDE